MEMATFHLNPNIVLLQNRTADEGWPYVDLRAYWRSRA